MTAIPQPAAAAPRTPQLSVVLVTTESFAVIGKTLRHLAAQTARDDMELVIVAPAALASALEQPARDVFPASRVVPVAELRSGAEGRATGVRAAFAPVVVFAEDHCFPEPGWAAALIEAHRGPWTVVGPLMENANPGTRVSWANLLLNYGPWIAPSVPTVAREVHHLPGHNSSYKRDVLVGYGDRLGAMLEAESFLHWELHAGGHRLSLDAAARTHHVNVTLLSAFVAEHLLVGRLSAALRAGQWPLPRRLLAICTTPLIPFRRVLTVLADIRRARRLRQLLPGVLPAVMLGLSCRAAGELWGYVLGAGDSVARLSAFEYDRLRLLTKADRAAQSLS